MKWFEPGFTYANGIVHTLIHNARPSYGTSAYHADSLDYDANGNVAAITDGATGRGQRGNRTMTYDGLDRLKTVASPMYGTTGATYTYDVLDNLTRVTIGGTHARDHHYCYDASWRLTNLKTGSCTGTTVVGLGYDVQGNLQNRNGRTFEFDYGNRLRSVAAETATGAPASSYVYDAHGRRVRDYTTASKYSHYLHNGQLALTTDSRRTKNTDYIYLAGSLIALRERDTVTNVYTTKYQHSDALSSPVVVTDQNRTILERSEYEPFGKVLAPANPADGPGYTGHVYDSATGLNYMQQRYYDPSIGRFLSVDPVTALSCPVGAFNRYWYANNNPYKFTDPDGREIAYALKNGATFSDQAATMAYLYSSPIAAGELAQLHFSDNTYTITFDRGADAQMRYDHDTRTVVINPTSGLQVDSSGEIQSPAIGAAHEISHAAEHDRIGTGAFAKNLEAPILEVKGTATGGISVKYGASPEERRATSVEGKVANELGEARRQDYKDEGGAVTTCGATSNKQC